ncbi:MAG: hypothetical protein U0174_25025 [Polyangiaceae bacterium]
MKIHSSPIFAAALLVFSLACGGKVTETSAEGSGSSPQPPNGNVASEGSSGSSGEAAGSSGSSGETGDTPVFASNDVFLKTSRVYLGSKLNACSSGTFQEYTYDRVSHVLSRRCDTSLPASEQDAQTPTSRTLGDAEVRRVEALLSSMRARSNPPHGGWDGPEYYLTVGNRTFSQSNVNGVGFPTVSAIQPLHALFDAIAF